MANEQTVANSEKPKTGLSNFIGETRREIAKVTWPTRREITQTTIIIVLFAIVAGFFFLIVDTGLGYLVSHLLGMSS